jgi:hypothetical protein
VTAITGNVGSFALDSLFILIQLAVALQMQLLAINHVEFAHVVARQV